MKYKTHTRKVQLLFIEDTVMAWLWVTKVSVENGVPYVYPCICAIQSINNIFIFEKIKIFYSNDFIAVRATVKDMIVGNRSLMQSKK